MTCRADPLSGMVDTGVWHWLPVLPEGPECPGPLPKRSRCSVWPGARLDVRRGWSLHPAVRKGSGSAVMCQR
ncbi:hypothetical protein NDU88_004551 [Pleurodeles waltl]|uniref:Uncharacterized protein n=1 Tax=Pleurodeles waltl TaxID=8319 RepID=A0AAV7UHD4_PLEWA|nr:hypothetical protein NDU88_004551 [Pleurodeles waltl]